MIRVNACTPALLQTGLVSIEEIVMPTETIVLLGCVVAVFAVFAAAVAWAEVSTRNLSGR